VGILAEEMEKLFPSFENAGGWSGREVVRKPATAKE
jgi:hypothetical protein